MMTQASFQHAGPREAANDAHDADQLAVAPQRSLSVAIFADRAHLRAQMRDDAVAAGFGIAHTGDLDGLTPDAAVAGDLVLVDCPVPGGGVLASLAAMDMRVASGGGRLVVSTSVASLDDVFACLDQSGAEILVDPSRADRVVALGRTLGRMAELSVRELAKEDRLVLLRLSEQVSRIADRLDRLAPLADPARDEGGSGTFAPVQGAAERGAERGADGGAFRFESPRPAYAGQVAAGGMAGPGGNGDDAGDRLVRSTRPPLPDPALIRRIVRQRQLRGRFFDSDLFADPAWDMLLDLTAARAEHTRVSVTSLCIASGVPPTTALRWITQMTDAGLLRRTEDDTDRRRAFITLTDRAADGMARYFAEIGNGAARLM